MLKPYHIEICQRALGKIFSPRALDVIIAANVGQDGLRGLIGHPEFHFDSNAFEASYAYMEEQRLIVLEILKSRGEITLAWEAFGRLTHTAQDFYAHSNYVQLWVNAHPKGDMPSPTQVGALDPKILQHPDLHSGNVYFWDWLAFVPGFYALALRLTPEDSHTHMNLDSPKQGSLFPYAFEAAIQRTVFEYEQITDKFDAAEQARFSDC